MLIFPNNLYLNFKKIKKKYYSNKIIHHLVQEALLRPNLKK